MTAIKQEPWDWLRKYLTAHGKTEAEVVIASAKKEGYTKAEIKLACLTRNVRKTSTKAPKRFYWELWEMYL